MPEDIASIIRRQTYKIWDHGDTITYGLPGGRMITYQFVDRKADAEVLEPTEIGWCAPSAPAIVYEAEVGITKDENIIIMGDYVRARSNGVVSGYNYDDSIYNTITPVVQQQKEQSRPQQHIPKNPKHTNQFKRKQPNPQPNSIALGTFLHVIDEPKQQGESHSRKKFQPKFPLMSIPLSS